MKTRCNQVVFALVACMASVFANAAVRLDDSASPRAFVQAPPMVSEFGYPLNQYRPGAPAPQRGIVDFPHIEYRLTTAPFMGRNSRIYFVIPQLIAGLRSPQGLVVSWRSEGRFSAGSGRPGDKVLVWSGVVREAVMSEVLTLRAEYTLSELLPESAKGISVEYYFEIEATP